MGRCFAVHVGLGHWFKVGVRVPQIQLSFWFSKMANSRSGDGCLRRSVQLQSHEDDDNDGLLNLIVVLCKQAFNPQV